MGMLSSERRRFLETATTRYMRHIHEAEPYLEGRGLDLDLVRGEGIGVVRDPLPGHEDYEGCLAIPYLTDAGPVNMRFRELPGKQLSGKYQMMKGWHGNIYGVQQISQGVCDDWIAVTEGEIDSLVLRQCGIPAVGIPGSKMFKDHWPLVFEDFSYVYLFTDGDTAGKGMYDTWQSRVKTAVIRVAMPDGMDVNEFYNVHGAEALRERINR